MSDEMLWQRMLDEQGYVVAEFHRSVPVGHVSHAMACRDGRTVETKSVVIAIATAGEYWQQCQRFDPGNDGIPKGPYFYRLIAE